MIDGGSGGTALQQGVQAAKDLVPLANSAPLGFAMVAVIAFAAGCLWLFARREKARSAELASMVEVNRDQAATMESMATLLEVLPTILSYLATIVAVLKINDVELQKAIEAARKAAEELSARRRPKRSTGSNVARPLPDDLNSGTKTAAGSSGVKGGE